jgi:hypothetical protein
MKVAFHRELIDHARNRVARQFELPRQLAARRQAASGRERAIEDCATQPVIELPVQRLAAIGPHGKIDQAGENLAHSTGLIIFSEMELSLRPVKIQDSAPVQQKSTRPS